jgi:ribosomal protein L11 methyltransferase
VIPIVIEPGQAFGTGAHATTRLSLALLLDQARAPMLDLGCGSGVLGIAAAKLGFFPVVALDVEQAAVDATRENAAANGVEIDVRLADVLIDDLPRTTLAVANLDRRLIEQVAGRLEARFLIASGYLESESPELPAWERRRRIEDDGWAAELFERPAPSTDASP